MIDILLLKYKLNINSSIYETKELLAITQMYIPVIIIIIFIISIAIIIVIIIIIIIITIILLLLF